MSIPNPKKLKQAILLDRAVKDGKEAFILLKKLDELEEQIADITIPDNKDIKGELKRIKQELEQDFEIELEIV